MKEEWSSSGVYIGSDGVIFERENAVLTCITNSMDNVYYLTNSKFVGPPAFRLIYLTTGAFFVKITLLYLVFLLSFQFEVII